MNEVKNKEFLAYLEKELESCHAEEEQLKLDDRKDEANNAKVRGNIFGIFHQMFDVLLKQVKDENSNEKLIASFKGFLVKLPQNWYANLEQARKHNNIRDIMIEEIKIAAKDEIEKRFMEVYNER